MDEVWMWKPGVPAALLGKWMSKARTESWTHSLKQPEHTESAFQTPGKRKIVVLVLQKK